MEEHALIDAITMLELSEVRMHGVAAKRRVAHFGWIYGYESWRLTRGPELPGFLKPLRERAAHLLGCQPEELAEMLVTEYPSAGIATRRCSDRRSSGISLGAACRFCFLRKAAGGTESTTWLLEPRSAYSLSGTARSQWQHSIPSTSAAILHHLSNDTRGSVMNVRADQRAADRHLPGSLSSPITSSLTTR